jgi:hypothetical protein
MKLSATHRGFAYPGIIREAIRDRLSRVGRGLLQRRLRRRLGNDPTRAIQSPSDAVDTADALLAPLSRHDANYSDVWANVAVFPLAELLYAASRHPGGRGIEWVRHALVNVEADETVPGWRQAADIWDQAGAPFPGQRVKIAGLESRQRHLVILVMHAAIAPWLPGRTGRPSW